MCEPLCVATNLDIDQKLLEEAVSLGKHRSKKAAVTDALVEYIAHKKQQEILGLFGKIDYDPKLEAGRRRAKA